MFASSSLQLVVKNKQTKNNPDLLKQKSRMINKICRATKWVGVWGPGIALGELLPCKKPGARLPFCRNWKGSSEALGYGLCCILEGILTASHSLWHSLERKAWVWPSDWWFQSNMQMHFLPGQSKRNSCPSGVGSGKQIFQQDAHNSELLPNKKEEWKLIN